MKRWVGKGLWDRTGAAPRHVQVNRALAFARLARQVPDANVPPCKAMRVNRASCAPGSASWRLTGRSRCHCAVTTPKLTTAESGRAFTGLVGGPACDRRANECSVRVRTDDASSVSADARPSFCIFFV